MYFISFLQVATTIDEHSEDTAMETDDINVSTVDGSTPEATPLSDLRYVTDFVYYKVDT